MREPSVRALLTSNERSEHRLDNRRMGPQRLRMSDSYDEPVSPAPEGWSPSLAWPSVAWAEKLTGKKVDGKRWLKCWLNIDHTLKPKTLSKVLLTGIAVDSPSDFAFTFHVSYPKLDSWNHLVFEMLKGRRGRWAGIQYVEAGKVPKARFKCWPKPPEMPEMAFKRRPESKEAVRRLVSQHLPSRRSGP
jgi:hypothetical protein